MNSQNSMAPTVSIVICSFNRCDSLADTLESVRTMDVPDEIQWDVLVVDNNSTDRTRDVVGAFARSSGLSVRYLFEPRQGLSYARNLGIAASQNECIAFTDDDVLVERNWLKCIVETFRQHSADCVGGKVVPYWLGKRPRWLHDNLLNVLAMLDYGDTALTFSSSDPRCLFGANFAFRRKTLLETGLFNVDLGRKGAFGCGEDKEMFEKIVRGGGRAIYNPRIIVLHKVVSERLSKKFFRKWHYAAGRDRAKVTRDCRFKVFGVESYLFRDAAVAVYELLGSVVKGRRDVLFDRELKCILYFSIFKHKLLRY